jgi:hypothetical protein
MSTPAPHLLTLPREIRNLIYSYLWHDEGPDLRLQYENTGMAVHFENLPDTNIANVHPQIRSELLKDGYCSKNTSMTVLTNENLYYKHVESGTIYSKADAGVAIARHVRLFLVFVSDFENLWECTKNIFDDLKRNMPQLESLTLAVCGPLIYKLDDALFDDLSINLPKLNKFSDYGYYPSPPATLVGLQFVRGSQGFRVDFTCVVEVESLTTVHRLSLVGVFLFNLTGSPEPAPDLVETLNLLVPGREYPKDCLAMCSKEKAALLSKMQHEVYVQSHVNADGSTIPMNKFVI